MPIPSHLESVATSLCEVAESLRNDGRVWVPKAQGDDRPPGEIQEA